MLHGSQVLHGSQRLHELHGLGSQEPHGSQVLQGLQVLHVLHGSQVLQGSHVLQELHGLQESQVAPGLIVLLLGFAIPTKTAMVSSYLPSLVITVISAPVFAMAVTNPFSSTVTLLLSLDSQITALFVASDGSIVADNWSVSPIFKYLSPPSILTPVTGTIFKQPLKKNAIIKKTNNNLHNLLSFLIFMFIFILFYLL